jgi:hypothetical protein
MGKLFEYLDLKKDTQNNRLIVFSDWNTQKETYWNKDALSKAGFRFDRNINSWTMPLNDMQKAVDALNNINNQIAAKFKGKGLEDKRKTIIAGLEHFQNWLESQDIPETKAKELDSKLDQYIQDIANATDERAAMAELKRFFDFMEKFHKYSFANTMLIYLQKRDASNVAGKVKWFKQFHRKLKQGAVPIFIWCAEVYKYTVSGEEKTEADPGDNANLDDAVKNSREVQTVRFKPCLVFDVSDTEPIDERGEIPEEPKWHADNIDNPTANVLHQIITKELQDLGVKVTQAQAMRGEGGYSAGGHINISAGSAGINALQTLIHEWAHELMHHRNSPIKDPKVETSLDKGLMTLGELKQLRELQAEAVSAVVSKHFGIPAGHQPTYLALWKVKGSDIKNNVEIIRKVANYMINEIDKTAEKIMA